MNTAEKKWYDNCIFVKTRYFVCKIQAKDVFVIEKIGRKLKIVLEGDTYEYYERIENVEPALPEYFCKSNKGCFINFHRVKFVANQMVEMDNGYKVVLGRNSYVKTKQQYHAYIQDLIKR